MALPELPAENEDPWFVKRNAFDQAVKSELEGRLSEDQLSATIDAAVEPLWVTPSTHPSFVAIGDSITSYSVNNLAAYCRLGASIAGDRVLDWRIFATGGANTQAIHVAHLPQVLALPDRPAYCLVATGTNDLGVGYDFNALKAAHQSLLGDLQAAGITPILWAPPPRVASEVTANANTLEYAQYIYALAEARNLEVLDANAILADGSGALDPALALDSVHPNDAGHLILGRVLGGILRRLLPKRVAPLIESQYDAATQMGLFLVDSNADGRADGVGNYAGAPGSLVSGAAFGKWQRISVASGAAYSGALRVDLPVVGGHEYDFGFMLKADIASAGVAVSTPVTWRTSSDALEAIDNANGARFPNATKWLAGDTLHLFTRRVAPPSASILRIDFTLGGTAAADGWAQIAQLTFRDRTDAGLA